MKSIAILLIFAAVFTRYKSYQDYKDSIRVHYIYDLSLEFEDIYQDNYEYPDHMVVENNIIHAVDENGLILTSYEIMDFNNIDYLGSCPDDSIFSETETNEDKFSFCYNLDGEFLYNWS